MRKKSLNGKRVMAFALAFSLVLGEASAVVAAPADASATCATETVAEQAPEAKTAEEAVAPEAETAEEAVAPESVETEVQRSLFQRMMRIWMQMRHMMEAFQK